MVTKKEVLECKRMSRKWKQEERSMEDWHIAPACSLKWIEKEKAEPWHKSLHKSKMDWNKWMKEESKEHWHSKSKQRKK